MEVVKTLAQDVLILVFSFGVGLVAFGLVQFVALAIKQIRLNSDSIRQEAQEMKAPEARNSKPPITRPAQVERVCK